MAHLLTRRQLEVQEKLMDRYKCKSEPIHHADPAEISELTRATILSGYSWHRLA